jgi:hypothetical protein
MFYLVLIVSVVSFAIMAWRASMLIGIRHAKLFFDPCLFFLLGYCMIVFFPHFTIFVSETFDTQYVTFLRGQTPHALLAASLFGVIWVLTVTLFPAPLKKTILLFSKGSTAPARGDLKLGIAFLLGFAAIGFDLVLFGFSGSVGTHLAMGLLKGNLSQFYDQYTELRYAVTTQPMLERGIRGLGTLTSIMDFLSYASLALGWHMTKGLAKGPKWLPRSLLFIMALYIALATGTRTAIVYFGFFTILVVMLVNQKNRIRNALQGMAAVLGFLIVFTAITPKSELGRTNNPFVAVLQRFSGNAVNDATIIESQQSGEFTFKQSLFGASEDFVPLDRQLTYFYTQDNTLPWYETPTCLAGYYVWGGYISVLINAIITGLLCRGFSAVIRRQRDPAMIVPMFGLLCVFNLRLPLSGWLSPSTIIAAVMVFALLKLSTVLTRKEQRVTARLPSPRGGRPVLAGQTS